MIDYAVLTTLISFIRWISQYDMSCEYCITLFLLHFVFMELRAIHQTTH